MGGSGFSADLIFLAFLAFVILGPCKLPEILKNVGRLMREVRRASSEFQGQFSREIGDLEPSQAAKTFRSLADRLSAAKAANGTMKTIMAMAESSRTKQDISATTLIDNVNRIKNFLAKNEMLTEAPQAEQPPCPAELLTTEMFDSCATGETTCTQPDSGGSHRSHS